ncbi:MAG: aminoglycoside phosphotransferase family protein [Chloroflexota bacterium]|nr:aminoglycoside phosphotransferase family protein [Chloroflexota bacterium]
MTAAALDELAPLDELEPLDELLGRHGLAGAAEQPFPNDGWSGATMTRLLDASGRAYVLKRDSLDRDWIAQATADRPLLREAWFAAHGPVLPRGIRNPALGAGWDAAAGKVGILMPDLSSVLFDWNLPLGTEQLDHVLDALAVLHGHAWRERRDVVRPHATPWTERLTLICRPSLERPGPARTAVADRLLPGWDAWDRLATPAARGIVAELANHPEPLIRALSAEPWTLLHGDLKLANVGIATDGVVEMVDWQMLMIAPVAIELGWFLVANVASLPMAPDRVLERYRLRLDARTWTAADERFDGQRDVSRVSPVMRWEAQEAAAILVGLLLRGWRKGADAEAGIVHASGVSAADDLAWWCERAVEAAELAL